ncbi:HSP20-like chaperone [Aspergillus tamarii]|uniref:HSP20-like chaperone n=1 Tax=Aspergillus tamarii TaxID=41984 RepID=A0A5N6UN47_ASPTM|nr:HSP20-like chaperone [Aspergillus tamarii]
MFSLSGVIQSCSLCHDTDFIPVTSFESSYPSTSIHISDMIYRSNLSTISSRIPGLLAIASRSRVQPCIVAAQGRLPKARAMTLMPQFHRGPSAIKRLLDDYDRYLSGHSLDPHPRAYAPTFDMRESKDTYQLEGELPGVKLSDVEIEYVDAHTINIKGHTEHASEMEEGSWWISERATGDFRRSFSFPSAVDQENTHARLKDGVLSVTIPKVASTWDVKKVKVEE